MLLSGCDSKSSNKDLSANSFLDSESDTTTVITDTIKPIVAGNITGSGSTINISINGENGEACISGLAEPQNLNKGLDLTVYTSFEANTAIALNEVTANIYVFCNGHIIQHSDDIDGEPAEVTKHTIKNNNVEISIQIYIPPTSIGKIEDALLWVCIDYTPWYIPADDIGELTTMNMWYVPVYSEEEGSIADVYDAQSEDYIDDKLPRYHDGSVYDSPYADIGIYRDDVYSRYDLSEIGDDTDFSITAFFEGDCDYYLALLCNGELTDIFDGKKIMRANCNGGKRMIKYDIDKSSLPGNGTYAYQVIALPENSKKENDSSIINKDSCGKKRRITLSIAK